MIRHPLKERDRQKNAGEEKRELLKKGRIERKRRKERGKLNSHDRQLMNTEKAEEPARYTESGTLAGVA